MTAINNSLDNRGMKLQLPRRRMNTRRPLITVALLPLSRNCQTLISFLQEAGKQSGRHEPRRVKNKEKVGGRTATAESSGSKIDMARWWGETTFIKVRVNQYIVIFMDWECFDLRNNIYIVQWKMQ